MEYEEKSPYTIRKYIRDTMAFIEYAGDNNLSKETVISCVEDAFSRKGESNDTGRGLDEKIQ